MNPSKPSQSHSSRRFPFVLPLLLVFLCVVNVLKNESGVDTSISLSDAVHVITSHLTGNVTGLENSMNATIWYVRLPRTLGAGLIGALLSLSGVAFQSFLQNPLADPYMVGVSAGAALGSVLVILLGGAALLGGFLSPIAAFGFGLLAVFVVMALAKTEGRINAKTFLLGGVVVGTFLWSLIPLAISLANRDGHLERQSAILAQLLGNLNNIGWTQTVLLFPFALVGGILLFRGATELNLLTSGEETAASLGLEVEGFKRKIIFAGALATAATVSVAGIIAFVGLVTPHIARRLVGADHRRLLPAAMWLGAIVLVGSDLLARSLPATLEVGVVTSLLGAPVFCFLLRRNQR